MNKKLNYHLFFLCNEILMSRNDLSKSEPWDTNYPVKALSHPLTHAASFSRRPESVFGFPSKQQ